MNRRHLTEGQKSFLANEYRKILSEKAKTQRAEIAVTQREINRGNILSDTAADKMNEKHEVNTRKEASNKFKVSERKVRTVQEIERTAPKVYEKLGSGDLQIHEAKIIAQLPKDGAKAPLSPMLMAILFVATMAILADIPVMLVHGLPQGIIRGFGSVLHILREPPFPVTGFTVHFFSRDSRGHASMLRRVRI